MSTANDLLDAASEQQKELVRQLLEHGVQFLVVGGFAVRFYVPERFPEDLDLLYAPTTDNVERLCRALEALGAGGLAEIRKRGARPRAKIPWDNVELLSSMEGFAVQELTTRAVEAVTTYGSLSVIAKCDLLRAKRIALADPARAASHCSDKADVDLLERSCSDR